MSAVIAEGYEQVLEIRESFLALVEQPVVSLAELPQDELLRARSGHFIRTIGRIAVDQERETPESQSGTRETLLQAIKQGAEGDVEATSMVKVNVGSDFSERVLKTGEVTKYYLKKRDDGELIQFGQIYTDIYANTLKLTPVGSKMRSRTEAETRNAVRAKFWEAQGALEDNYLVVWSPCADDMTEAEMEEAGFFSETKTLAIQATTSEGGGVSIESGFLAGVKAPNAERHDIDMIVEFAATLGIDYRGLTAAEIIDRPMLIPKSMMPNGVIDLVEMCDDIAGGTFFGENKPRQDYGAYRQFCDERRKSFAEDIDVVTKQLLSEADFLHTPLQAVQRLDKLSEVQMVRRAVKDQAINPRVFGVVAAAHIEHARRHFESGNSQAVRLLEDAAIQTAKSKSCPSGVDRSSDIDQDSLDQKEGDNNPESDTDKYGSLTFKCPKGHTNRRPRNKLIPYCKSCGVSVKC